MKDRDLKDSTWIIKKYCIPARNIPVLTSEDWIYTCKTSQRTLP